MGKEMGQWIINYCSETGKGAAPTLPSSCIEFGAPTLN